MNEAGGDGEVGSEVPFEDRFEQFDEPDEPSEDGSTAAAADPEDDVSGSRPHQWTVRQVVQFGLGIGLAGALLIWGLPFFAKTSWAEIWGTLSAVPLPHVVGFQALMLLGLYCYTFTLTGALPGLSHAKALILNLCGSSVSNLLPGGGAVGLAATYAMCRSWGFNNRSTSTMAIVTGIWNVLARIALPVIAIVALWWGNRDLPEALRDAAVGGMVTGAIVIGVLVATIASERQAQRIGRFFDRVLRPLFKRSKRTRTMSIDQLVREMRARITETVRTGWIPMTLGMVGFFGVYFVLFIVIMRDVGVDRPLGILFAAYAIGRLLTAVGITPGGLGVTETATAAALVGWGAAPGAATAGVVLFSVITHLMEVPLGGLGWLAWTASLKKSARANGAAAS
ncbi:MAG TPA: lysylphosphatidylglycerol synthase transmembrane domain-containing protein [Phycicoccus sp.]|nr:lysylphosphatidylglycerol synthase transmembrane domain-containing protein [Phycicoccus sp.]HQV91321.1 lysylphosphatidylglycerol synthase transmembrane domain-containing protein [Phycicoccus sp.]HQY96322.1 lysylphosphatidylglycerol synthase transmembrane domain-containing protein [Phycicoccus sp.]HRA44209.1 lysylphosphatidylglycerol synthase transmembrane domain-containing protein [Phycicoccus sp.]